MGPSETDRGLAIVPSDLCARRPLVRTIKPGLRPALRAAPIGGEILPANPEIVGGGFGVVRWGTSSQVRALC